ncbi:hypothetical protein BVX98_05880 [bacterium F11]|nr:hypothetical protein BVX98_05880 [bacterium F11]
MKEFFVLIQDNSTKGLGMVDYLDCPAISDYELHQAKSLAKRFKPGSLAKFSKNFPTSRRLSDFQPNILGIAIVSKKARDLIAPHVEGYAEFLPIQLVDQEEKVVSSEYSVFNLIGSEDAIDLDKSKYRINRLNKSQIKSIQKMVLNHKAIDQEKKIFRARQRLRLILIRNDLRNVLLKNGITGLIFFKADGWNGFDF